MMEQVKAGTQMETIRHGPFHWAQACPGAWVGLDMDLRPWSAVLLPVPVAPIVLSPHRT